ncbi:MAG: isoprenylcysteine carboxylmethyltransferase family protein [Bryobacterales bacterium]|nr:isoprenylcysteine carboxylmethyltransferase family protein [Bryobacterales bacterium]MBV9400104.1 isoprenylcysteine carboxylmethyltransferase family protein [Bryobacterales bacterium]
MRSFFQVLTVPAWWLISLFGGSGNLTWGRGWVCTFLYLGALIICRVIINRLNPGLLEQREKPIRQDTKSFDKMFLRVFLSLTILQPIIAGVDKRFNGAPIPLAAVYPGIILFMIAATVITWVLVENPHAESSVRIQVDRGHHVVVSGPYRFVRHPMYVGLIFLHASIALILGSMWNLGLAALIAILFLWRTALEDQTLRRELPGYEEYATVTRYRIVPGIW